MVYIVTDGSGFVKIGVARNLKRRLRELQTGNPRNIYPIKTIVSPYDYEVEHALHRKYSKYRVNTENGVTEWFDGSEINCLEKTTALDVCFLLQKEGILIDLSDVRVIDYLEQPQNYGIEFLAPLLDSKTYTIIEQNGFKTVAELWEHLFVHKQIIMNIGYVRTTKIRNAIESIPTRKEKVT